MPFDEKGVWVSPNDALKRKRDIELSQNIWEKVGDNIAKKLQDPDKDQKAKMDNLKKELGL